MRSIDCYLEIGISFDGHILDAASLRITARPLTEGLQFRRGYFIVFLWDVLIDYGLLSQLQSLG